MVNFGRLISPRSLTSCGRPEDQKARIRVAETKVIFPLPGPATRKSGLLWFPYQPPLAFDQGLRRVTLDHLAHVLVFQRLIQDHLS